MFYCNAIHIHLPNLLLPCLDETMDKVKNTANRIEFGFLALLKTLRWVILQDIAVITFEYNRTHYIYKQLDKVFESDAFNNYADRIVDHLKLSENTDQTS